MAGGGGRNTNPRSEAPGVGGRQYVDGVREWNEEERAKRKKAEDARA